MAMSFIAIVLGPCHVRCSSWFTKAVPVSGPCQTGPLDPKALSILAKRRRGRRRAVFVEKPLMVCERNRVFRAVCVTALSCQGGFGIIKDATSPNVTLPPCFPSR
eukprot:766593-Hanusia_phi.AAC.2